MKFSCASATPICYFGHFALSRVNISLFTRRGPNYSVQAPPTRCTAPGLPAFALWNSSWELPIRGSFSRVECAPLTRISCTKSATQNLLFQEVSPKDVSDTPSAWPRNYTKDMRTHFRTPLNRLCSRCCMGWALYISLPAWPLCTRTLACKAFLKELQFLYLKGCLPVMLLL